MLSHLEELKPDFDLVEDPRERYEMLIEIGKELEDFPEELMTDENRVPGCISGVFVDVKLNNETVEIKATSHSLIVRGYVKILLDTLNGMSKYEILDAETAIQKFIEDTGISQSLVATRANAFGNIYQTIVEKVKKL